jgi:hypothetical protein
LYQDNDTPVYRSDTVITTTTEFLKFRLATRDMLFFKKLNMFQYTINLVAISKQLTDGPRELLLPYSLSLLYD